MYDEIIDVGNITARDVPTAKCINVSSLYPVILKAKNKAGTIIMPPPAPKRPAKKPDIVAKQSSIMIVFRSNIFFIKL